MAVYKSFTHEEATERFRLPADRDLKRTKTINVALEDPSNAAAEAKLKQEQLRQYFHATYEIFEKCLEPLNCDEAFTVPPVHKLRHPLIFYLGHTATFYLNKIALAGLTTRINHKFEETFAIGVDEMSWDDLNEAHYDWPAVADVWKYRRALRERIDDLFAKYTMPLPLTFENSSDDDAHAFFWAVLMGCEHERIHLETSSVLLRQLPIRLVTPPPGWTLGPREAPAGQPKNELVAHPGGHASLGKPDNFPSFGWDNEYGKAEMDVPSFQVSKFLITNAEFLDFVEAGGYTDKQWWSEEGWRWVTFREAKHPTFWTCEAECKSGCGSALSCESHCLPAPAADAAAAESDAKRVKANPTYRYRTVFEVIDMPWSWPADVNYLEAKAYCKWRGTLDNTVYRLPTEAEYAVLRDAPPVGEENSMSGEVYVRNLEKGDLANINMTFQSSTPVNLYPPSKTGVYDMTGNVWQWVEDHFNGLPGFSTVYVYDDFSSPCFDSRHTMILSGSWISTGDEASRFARFAFRRHFFQHAGFRMVTSPNATPVRLTCMPEEPPLFAEIPGASEANVHPTTNRQLQFECQQFFDTTAAAEASEATAQLTTQLAAELPADCDCALFMGAGLGTVPLALLPAVGRMVGTDYWGRGVEHCTKRAAEAGLSNVVFKQLTWLPQEIGTFSACVIYQYLHRTLNADAWFPRMREVCRPGGTVIVADPKFSAADLQTRWGTELTLKKEFTAAGHDGAPIHVTVWTRN